jgi:hypothetical protein
MSDPSNLRAPLPKLTIAPPMIPSPPAHTLLTAGSPFTDLICVPKVA